MDGNERFRLIWPILFWIMLFLVGITVWTAWLLRPAVNGGYPHTQMKCRNNLQCIALALINYQVEHETLPPAFISDEQGRPMHSWRVLLLPYFARARENFPSVTEKARMEELYHRYRFDEPWDGPNNRKLADEIPEVYRCPGVKNEKRFASYLAVIGDETAWPGKVPRREEEMKDGLTKTILLVESANSQIEWTKPEDLHFDDVIKTFGQTNQLISSEHHYAQVLFADGHVGEIDGTSESPNLKQLKAALTVDGGENEKWTY